MALPELQLQPITELDAVNMMLLSIGQTPVNTLEVANIKDVSFARLTLHNTSRSVQLRGWWFNVEEDYPLTPDSNGNIAVGLDLLDLDCHNDSFKVVQRGERLYDIKNHTFTFTEAGLKFRVVRFLPWDEIPQAARDYIAVRAARIFQSQAIGSDILYRYDAALEEQALAPLQASHLRNSDTNILASSARTNKIYRRGRW